MVFTHLCRAVAIVAAFLGVFRVAIGLMIAGGMLDQESLARYTTASSSGVVVDEGLLAILTATVLGTLAEISFAVHKK